MRRIRLKIQALFKDYLPLKSYFKESRRSLALGLALLLAVDLAQLLIPLVIKKAIDSLTLQIATTRLLLHYSLMIMVIAAGMAVLRFVWRHLLFGFARRLEQSLRNRLYRHIQSLSASYYQRIKTGDLMAHFVNDINAIRMATGMGLVALTDGLVMGLMAIAFMIYISPLLTLIALIPAPFMIFFSARLTRRMALGHEKVQNSFGSLTEKVREAFAGIRVVKTYNRETWETKKIEQEGRNYIVANLDLARLLALFEPMLMIITNAGLVIVIWLGGRLTLFDRITTGDLVAFISYLNLLTWPMLAIGWVTSL
ncbi:MAG: ABC transporter ATP-binding protein, partial [Desulfobacteraceae bacterium]